MTCPANCLRPNIDVAIANVVNGTYARYRQQSVTDRPRRGAPEQGEWPERLARDFHDAVPGRKRWSKHSSRYGYHLAVAHVQRDGDVWDGVRNDDAAQEAVHQLVATSVSTVRAGDCGPEAAFRRLMRDREPFLTAEARDEAALRRADMKAPTDPNQAADDRMVRALSESSRAAWSPEVSDAHLDAYCEIAPRALVALLTNLRDAGPTSAQTLQVVVAWEEFGPPTWRSSSFGGTKQSSESSLQPGGTK